VDPGLLRDALIGALGVLTGVMSGLFGVGGAVISTPAIRALGVPPLLAVGTTLPSIIPGAAAGTVRYAREGLVDWRVVAVTAPAGIVSAVFGALAAEHIPGKGHVLMLMTAALLGYSAFRMLLTSRSSADASSHHRGSLVPRSPDEASDTPSERDAEYVPAPHHDAAKRRPLAFAGVGVVAGGLSGLLGIGGGIVMVPGFTQVGALPVKPAIATSLACVGLFAIPGTITHALLGNIDWHVALLLAAGVIPGARIGAALAIRSDDARLQRVVAVFLGLMAVAYGVGETAALLG